MNKTILTTVISLLSPLFAFNTAQADWSWGPWANKTKTPHLIESLIGNTRYCSLVVGFEDGSNADYTLELTTLKTDAKSRIKATLYGRFGNQLNSGVSFASTELYPSTESEYGYTGSAVTGPFGTQFLDQMDTKERRLSTLGTPNPQLVNVLISAIETRNQVIKTDRGIETRIDPTLVSVTVTFPNPQNGKDVGPTVTKLTGFRCSPSSE